jgi:ADP-ribose pyrophosphatase YjhB (NUDIX family)
VTHAALRETAEEVGVALRPDRLSVVGVMHRKSDEERVDFFLAYRLGDATAPENREPEKCSELVWADTSRLPEDVIPYVRTGIANFRRGAWFQEFGWNDERA